MGEFRRRSRSLAREEFDDLVQECLAHWIVVRRKLAPDPGAPPTAYMAQVVRNKLTDLIREQAAEKRAGDQEALSLDAALLLCAWILDWTFVFKVWPQGIERLRELLAHDLEHGVALAARQGAGAITAPANALYSVVFEATGVHDMGT
ncbi:MAG TPA: sigma factor [Thiobacillaceae bacterium]|nr:sigma factor [Thiobacillaceae bacterium]HNU63698.1 sigma factor [Thiobacillaceae bacterium]